jgi:hypothetical protein
METLLNTATVLVEFDSDYDGVEIFVPYCGYVSLNGDYLATINIWDGLWEITDGYLTYEQSNEVEDQVTKFIKAVKYVH